MLRTRIRGIYSTALTKILLDHGFKIVQPSITIKERFHLSDLDSSPPDLDIYDRVDWQGVNAIGEKDAVDAFASLMKQSFIDIIIRRRTPLHNVQSLYEQNLVLPRIVKENEMEGSSISIRDFVSVEFPAMSKKKLDSIRGTVTPTIDGHHYFKACGGKIASILEMAEKMLERGAPRTEVESILKESIRGQYPRLNSRIDIEHVKIDGRLFHLDDAQIIDFDYEEGSLRLFRTFRGKGLYDGLKVPKEQGDYALTDLKIDDWTFRTSYFSNQGQYKGSYINLNTPIELYPGKIRYVDLEVDVCIWPDGRVEKIDLEDLEGKASKGYISERLVEITKEKLDQVISSISSG